MNKATSFYKYLGLVFLGLPLQGHAVACPLRKKETLHVGHLPHQVNKARSLYPTG
jgi:hypothetical protein